MASTQITAAHLGHPVTPHMFRDAAATFIAEMTPERAMMAAAVLQHRQLETTMRPTSTGSSISPPATITPRSTTLSRAAREWTDVEAE